MTATKTQRNRPQADPAPKRRGTIGHDVIAAVGTPDPSTRSPRPVRSTPRVLRRLKTWPSAIAIASTVVGLTGLIVLALRDRVWIPGPPDVLAVSVLAALPCVAVVFDRIRPINRPLRPPRRRPLDGTGRWGLSLLAAGVPWLLVVTAPPMSFGWADPIARSVIGGLVVAPVVALWTGAMRQRRGASRPTWGNSAAAIAATATIAGIVPSTYFAARCRDDARRLADYLEQSRVGEAAVVARRLADWEPTGGVHGRSYRLWVDELTATVARLSADVLVPLPPDPTDSERLVRATNLAMLGRTDDAIATVTASATLRNDPQACNLLGTVYETRQDWRQSRTWYEAALARSQTAKLSDEFPAGVEQALSAESIRAIRGLALCERKLGRIRTAEARYLSLLDVAPTAEHFYLVACFYEDIERTAEAKVCAEGAALRDPARYAGLADALIDRLATTQFGCFTLSL